MFTVEVVPAPEIKGFVVHLTGACDFSCTERFGETLAQIDVQGPTNVAFDCSRLDFIASIGLGQLIELRRNLVSRGGRLALAAMHPDIHRGVTYTRLDEVFEVYPTLESATRALASGVVTTRARAAEKPRA